MKDLPKSSATVSSRLMFVPALIGLVSASIILGYASGDLWPARAQHAIHRPLPTQVSLTRPSPGGQGPDRAAHEDGADNESVIEDEASDPLANYKATISLLQQNYYGLPMDRRKTQELTYEAIRGLLGSLRDQFTSFLDPDEWSQMQATTKGDFEGIGALLQQEGSSVKVVRPIETSPAERAGVKADDVIVSVDGKPVKGKDINDVVKLIKGRRGTRVMLGLLRGGKTQVTLGIMRSRVEPPVVEHWMEDDKARIGHITLAEFNEKSIEQLDGALKDLERQGMRALVFDLRNNPGGLLDTAIDVASVFIPADQNRELGNTVVFIHEGTGREKRLLLHPMEHTYRQVPLAVLVNDESASASEIVSGAIKDYGVGTLIGGRTFGKGRVQTLFPLDDGSALRLTTALYFPPKHHDINFSRDEDGMRIRGTGGIVPDIEVKQSPKWKSGDFKDKVDDTQLRAALQFLRGRLSGMTPAQAGLQISRAQ